MNNIIIELCTEDRARLDRIAALLEAGIGAHLKTPKTPTELPLKATKAEEQGNTQPKAETQSPPQKTEPESVKTDEPKAEKVDVGVEDIRRLVVTLSASGKKDEARGVVQAYARTVSDLPAEKYAEVWAKLKELEV